MHRHKTCTASTNIWMSKSFLWRSTCITKAYSANRSMSGVICPSCQPSITIMMSLLKATFTTRACLLSHLHAVAGHQTDVQTATPHHGPASICGASASSQHNLVESITKLREIRRGLEKTEHKNQDIPSHPQPVNALQHPPLGAGHNSVRNISFIHSWSYRSLHSSDVCNVGQQKHQYLDVQCPRSTHAEGLWPQ
jgi:hypothetical protein